MKEYLKTKDQVSVLTEKTGKDSFKMGLTSKMPFPSYLWLVQSYNTYCLRIYLLLIIIFIFPFRAGAPVGNLLVIPESAEINAFSNLMYAVGMVETMGNTLAYNELENAVGIFQIRQIRVDEYNRLTGSELTLADMFDYETSGKVFLYFAARIGPYNPEKIAKTWNGSGPMTELYWERIKEYL